MGVLVCLLFTIPEGLLYRQQRRTLCTRFRTRSRRRKLAFSLLSLNHSTNHLGAADGRLVLRHRRPQTQPYPNAYSHPLPRFHYHGDTGRLTVKFENDPEFAGGTAWSAKTFYVTALPRNRPRTLLDDATDALASAFRSPLSFFGGPPIPDDSTAAGMDDTFNLRQEEVEEQDRGEDAEDDDDPARDRAVRVIGLTPEEHRELGNKAWARRQWAVVPLRTAAARYSTTLP